ncbi:MAG TPA: iron-containing alcohol dehydrogenase [Bacteroidales bacterium]|nr:iron-containing alcohol dehydrogenase [Bacteroidales bacterium]HRW86572.1 iron-containing alcohol dehydrogenase [Bacteroidales bacterium]
MQDFEFYNPVRVFFGKDQMSKIIPYIEPGTRIMLLYGGGSIFKNGVRDRIKEVLKDFTITEFGGVEPNPSYETCMQAVDVIKAGNINFILAAGGGSVIDAAKFIASAALYQGEDPWDILASKVPVTAALPLASVLTLPATGSEMNKNAVISRKSTGEKLAFASQYSFPRFSVLLPEAAATLPRRQVANGVVDAFVHVLEQYLTYPVNSPLQDRQAEAVLLTLVEEGPRAYANPADYNAMANLMWSATNALNGLLSCGVPGDWSVHSIGHELTAFHGIDHARTLAIVQPGLWKALREEKKEKLIQYGKRIWNITGGSDEEMADEAIRLTVEFFESLGIPTRLSDYNVGPETIDRIVSRFESRNWLEMGDRGLTSPAIVRKALEFQL